MCERELEMRKIAFALAASLVTASVLAVGCNQKNEQEIIDIYMPDGAPALALGYPMYEDKADDGVEYHVVSSATIQSYVTGNSPKADVCVLPVNLAAKLLGDASAYKMAGVVTHGNMYLIANDTAQYARVNATDLIGKTVGVVQLNNVPGLTLKAALSGLDVPFVDLSDGASKSDAAVNLLPVDVQTLAGADLYLVPSPAADKRVEKAGFAFVGSLQELYGGENGYPQAAIVVKNEVLEKNGEWFGSFMRSVDASADWLETAEKTLIAETVQACLAEGLSPTFTAENLTDGAIAHSGVWLQYMDESGVQDVENFLRSLTAIDASKAAVPQKQFYYYGK